MLQTLCLNLKTILYCLLLGSVLLGCVSLASSGPATYGSKVTFTQSQPLNFPDFTLEYSGKRRMTDPNFPAGFLFHDFTVTHNSQTQTVSWSSGTGDIGPAYFEVDGQSYLLELTYADDLGWLAENELVIRPYQK